MADTEGSAPTAAAAAAASPKKKSNPKPKKSRPVANHPKIADMVNAAIANLKERGGSSLQAIKKYIASNYKVDVEKLAPFIKKYLKTAVSNGSLIQTKGKGASGSFKLSASSKPAPAASRAKKAEKKSVKKVVEKKVAKPKKRMEKKTATKTKKTEKKDSKPKKAKTPKKEKKAKAPKKPKSPKPKKSPAKKSARK